MAKHTPGPWEVSYHTVATLPFAYVITTEQEAEETAKANAMLIEAAPDLLAYAEISEAVGEYDREGSGFTQEMCMAVLTKHGYRPSNPDMPGIGAGKWAREFRKAVIAKAKGDVAPQAGPLGDDVDDDDDSGDGRTPWTLDEIEADGRR